MRDAELLFDSTVARLYLTPEDGSPPLPNKDAGESLASIQVLNDLVGSRGDHDNKVFIFLRPGVDKEGSQIFQGLVIPGKSGLEADDWTSYLSDLGMTLSVKAGAKSARFTMKRALLAELEAAIKLRSLQLRRQGASKEPRYN